MRNGPREQRYCSGWIKSPPRGDRLLRRCFENQSSLDDRLNQPGSILGSLGLPEQGHRELSPCPGTAGVAKPCLACRGALPDATPPKRRCLGLPYPCDEARCP